MTPKENIKQHGLEELGFAPAGYEWSRCEAANRIKEAMGWGALARYSLTVDTSLDPESLDAYPFLVADIVDGEPMIVGPALEDAEKNVQSIDDEARRKFLLERIAFFEKNLEEARKEADVEGGGVQKDYPESQKEPLSQPQKMNEETQQVSTVGEKESRMLVERLAREGRLLRAWGGDSLATFIRGLSLEPSIADDEGSMISPYEFFIRIIDMLPRLVPLEEIAPPQAQRDDSLESIGRKIARALDSGARRSS